MQILGLQLRSDIRSTVLNAGLPPSPARWVLSNRSTVFVIAFENVLSDYKAHFSLCQADFFCTFLHYRVIIKIKLSNGGALWPVSAKEKFTIPYK